MCCFLVQELLNDPATFAKHVILPNLLCFLRGTTTTLEQNLGGVEPVHTPLPHIVEPVNLLNLAARQVAVVHLEFSNGSVKELPFRSLIGP